MIWAGGCTGSPTPGLAQGKWTKTSVLAFPWEGKELVEAPRISDEDEWQESFLIQEQPIKIARGACFVSCTDTNTERQGK